jgi:acid phosphatase (class A)
VFLNLAEEVCRSRALMGIHYPSDNEISWLIAWNLLKYRFMNPQFVKIYRRPGKMAGQ